MKREWKYIGMLAGIFIILVLVEINKPTPVDWTPSFSQTKKTPYGNYVLADMISDIFRQSSINYTNKTIYETIGENSGAKNYIFINDHFKPDELDTETLLQYVASGNTVFVAANQFEGPFADTLKIKTKDYLFYGFEDDNDVIQGTDQDSIRLNFVNPALKKKEDYKYKNGLVTYFFSSYDSSAAVILGTSSKNKATYVKLHYGLGNIYISSTPYAFTNYYMLYKDNSEYISAALSYLPEGNILWDEYYKVGRGEQNTPLRFIVSKTALAWAYGITIASLFFYTLFEAKRRQRIIPIVAPPQNATLEFVDTIGRLYYQYGDHANLAQKKITYFMESIRSRFNLKTNILDEEFVSRLSEKSNVEREQVKMLISLIRRISESGSVTEDALIRLNDQIDRFNKNQQFQ